MRITGNLPLEVAPGQRKTHVVTGIRPSVDPGVRACSHDPGTTHCPGATH